MSNIHYPIRIESIGKNHVHVVVVVVVDVVAVNPLFVG